MPHSPSGTSASPAAQVLESLAKTLARHDVTGGFLAGDAALVLRGARRAILRVALVIDPQEVDEVASALNEEGYQMRSPRASTPLLDWAKAVDPAFRVLFQPESSTSRPTASATRPQILVATSCIRIPEFDSNFGAGGLTTGTIWDTPVEAMPVGNVAMMVATPEAVANADKISVERVRRLKDDGSLRPPAFAKLDEYDLTIASGEHILEELPTLKRQEQRSLKFINPSGLGHP